MTTSTRGLRPLRLLLPFAAIGAALVLFLGLTFFAFTIAGGGGGAPAGPCDTGVGSADGPAAGAPVPDPGRRPGRRATAERGHHRRGGPGHGRARRGPG